MKLEATLSIMPRETSLKLLSKSWNPDLTKRISKWLDREMEKDIFENPSGTENGTLIDENDTCFPESMEQYSLYMAQDFNSGEPEEFYKTGRER